MGLNEFLDKEETTSKELVRADEGQLIIAQEFQKGIVMIEHQEKEIKKQKEALKTKLYEVMKANGITGYESNDKKIKITLGEDSVTETIDKEALFLKHPDIYREFVKETPRKGTLRITIREENSND